MNNDARSNLEPTEKAVERLGANAVFGEPIGQGDITVIPVAEVGLGFGYGYGSGRNRTGEAHGTPNDSEGSGDGSGADGKTSPKGYIGVSSEGVRFEPVWDVTRIALAGMALAAWAVFWIVRALQARVREK